MKVIQTLDGIDLLKENYGVVITEFRNIQSSLVGNESVLEKKVLPEENVTLECHLQGDGKTKSIWWFNGQVIFASKIMPKENAHHFTDFTK